MGMSTTRRSKPTLTPTKPSLTPKPHARPAQLPHVDVHDLDGVVAVAQTVPGRDVGLDVAGRIGRARAERRPSDAFGLPFVRPVLPPGRAFRLLDLRWVPVAVAREADVDVRDRPRAGPRLSAHRVGALRDDRRRCWVGDADVP